MERLPQYWAVRNDESVDFKNSVIRYIESQDHWFINHSDLTDGFCGRSHDGFFYNLTNQEVNKKKEIVLLPLHLFKTLLENEKKPKSTRKSVTIPPSPTNRGVLVGFTLKSGVANTAALRALGIEMNKISQLNLPSLPLTFTVNDDLHSRAIAAGVLNLLFEPVYKEKHSDVIVRHAKGHLIAHIQDGIATIDGQRFTIEDVQRILSTSKINGVPFIPTTFTTGCNKQYEGIGRKDIEQVLDQMLPF